MQFPRKPSFPEGVYLTFCSKVIPAYPTFFFNPKLGCIRLDIGLKLSLLFSYETIWVVTIKSHGK